MAWENELSEMIGGQKLGSTIQLAVMSGSNSCKIGNLELKKDDLMFSDRLVSPTCTKVSETAPDGGGACTDSSTYLTALKSGDVVAVYQLSDSKYLVLGRMISL